MLMERGLAGSAVRPAARKAGRYKGEEDAVTNNVDILNEIFRHLNATSLGKAACVSKKWKQATQEEALWEAICTRNWPATASASAAAPAPAAGQLKSVVVALGGFKRLYVNCLHPLLSRNNNSNALCKQASKSVARQKWSKDEVYLSLSLFSIDCYERIAPQSSSSSHTRSLLCKPSFNSDVRRLLLDGWRGKCKDGEQ
ncbi:hypothetical protein KI387_018456, partial [Taxus chinensis]